MLGKSNGLIYTLVHAWLVLRAELSYYLVIFF